MHIYNFKLDAHLSFDKDCIESFLLICEEVIDKITENENAKFKLKSAAHELIVNSLEHGYQKGSGRVCFSLQKEDDKVILEILDEGKGLDPLSVKKESPDMTLDSIKGRGWGLIIINKLAEQMEVVKNTPCGTKIAVTIQV